METNHSVPPSNPSAFRLGAEIVSNPDRSSSALPGSRGTSFEREHKVPLLKIKLMNNFPFNSRVVVAGGWRGGHLILAITNY